MNSSGTIVAVCYVREGFCIASDSIGYRGEGERPLRIQKVFRLTDRIGCALAGISHFRNNQTGQEMDLAALVRQTAAGLPGGTMEETAQAVSNAYRQGIAHAQAQLGARLEGQRERFSELLFAGFEGERPLLYRVEFTRDGEEVGEPRFERICLREPSQFLHSVLDSLPPLDAYLGNPTIDALVIYALSGAEGLPEDFTLEQAVEVATTYVNAGIAVGHPEIGGPCQAAIIPREGVFTFR